MSYVKVILRPAKEPRRIERKIFPPSLQASGQIPLGVREGQARAVPQICRAQ